MIAYLLEPDERLRTRRRSTRCSRRRYALPGKLLMGTSGFVVDAIGYPSFFVYTSTLGLPALVLLCFVVRRGMIDGALGTAGESADG